MSFLISEMAVVKSLRFAADDSSAVASPSLTNLNFSITGGSRREYPTVFVYKYGSVSILKVTVVPGATG